MEPLCYSPMEESYRTAMPQVPHLQLERVNTVAEPYEQALAHCSPLHPHCGWQGVLFLPSCHTYMRPVWQHFMHILKQLLILLRARRRRFIDLHVARVRERIKELNRGGDETVIAYSPSTPSISLVTSVSVPVVSPVVQGVSARPDETRQTASAEPVGPSSVTSFPSESFPISTPTSEPSQTSEEAASEASSSTSSSLVESMPVKMHTPARESISLSTTAPSSTPAIVQPLDDDVPGSLLRRH